MPKKYESELDYLAKSLDYLDGQHTSCLTGLRDAKSEMALLTEDMDKIKNPRLKEAAMKTFNHFSAEKGKFEDLIKEIWEDQGWIRLIIKSVRRSKK